MNSNILFFHVPYNTIIYLNLQFFSLNSSSEMRCTKPFNFAISKTLSYFLPTRYFLKSSVSSSVNISFRRI
nr:MAG TPA: hypothetical protein [Caudoviricetes sp.]